VTSLGADYKCAYLLTYLQSAARCGQFQGERDRGLDKTLSSNYMSNLRSPSP